MIDRDGLIGLVVFIACTVLWGQCGGIHLAHGEDIPSSCVLDIVKDCGAKADVRMIKGRLVGTDDTAALSKCFAAANEMVLVGANCSIIWMPPKRLVVTGKSVSFPRQCQEYEWKGIYISDCH